MRKDGPDKVRPSRANKGALAPLFVFIQSKFLRRWSRHGVCDT
jgi:hypothetical protein